MRIETPWYGSCVKQHCEQKVNYTLDVISDQHYVFNSVSVTMTTDI